MMELFVFKGRPGMESEGKGILRTMATDGGGNRVQRYAKGLLEKRPDLANLVVYRQVDGERRVFAIYGSATACVEESAV